MENGMANERFWDARTFRNYALCNEFVVFAICEKIEKSSVPKWLPKCMNIHVTIHPKAAWGHLFFDFNILQSGQQINNFRLLSGGPQIWKNRSRNYSKDALPAQPDGQGMVEGIVFGAWVPRAATSAR